MQPYGYKRAYRLDNETVQANYAESRKQAPKGCDSARRKTARQEARSVIKAATLH